MYGCLKIGGLVLSYYRVGKTASVEAVKVFLDGTCLLRPRIRVRTPGGTNGRVVSPLSEWPYTPLCECTSEGNSYALTVDLSVWTV
jgi:hypothetical protein